MVNQQNTFVFVVCGDEKYISALNLAIEFLQAASKSNIAVITDLRRNKAQIIGPQIIDVSTPPDLTHHQASVFLKTSLHRYLDMERGRYCYLDSDVLALTNRVDEVFWQQPGIIGFCADNMTLDLFSPYAVNCGCLEQARADEQRLNEAQEYYKDFLQEWKAFVKLRNGDVLDELIRETAKNPAKNIYALSRFYAQKALPFFKTAAFKGYSYNKHLQAWLDSEGKVVLFPIPEYYDYIAENTGFVFDKAHGYWYDGLKQDVCIPQCNHLHQQIKSEYSLSIDPEAWQHWNGGVFLFDKHSVEFLEYWHLQTMAIFNKPAWKTRDQGTLALTAWKFGLQHQECLNPRFNYIADSYKPGLGYDPEKGFTRDGGNTYQRPELLHVYHRFGDTSWDFWQQIMASANLKGIDTHE